MPVSKSMDVGPTTFDKIWITRFLANHFLVDSPIKLDLLCSIKFDKEGRKPFNMLADMF